jgi:hypothetical protein
MTHSVQTTTDAKRTRSNILFAFLSCTQSNRDISDFQFFDDDMYLQLQAPTDKP